MSRVPDVQPKENAELESEVLVSEVPLELLPPPKNPPNAALSALPVVF